VSTEVSKTNDTTGVDDIAENTYDITGVDKLQKLQKQVATTWLNTQKWKHIANIHQ